jgi:hypothetical protein
MGNMGFPVRRIAAVPVGLLLAGVLVAQAPPPPPEPAPGTRQREIPGGTIVVTPPTRTVTSEPAAVTTAEAAPQPLGYESDLYCFGYLGPAHESFPAQVVSAESLAEQIDYFTGDLLYVDAGHNRGLKVGDEFWLVTPEQTVVHPTTGRDFGRFYQYRGRAVVETLQGRSAAVRITSSCSDVPLGSYLKPFEPIPIPLARKTAPAVAGDPPSGKVTGRIVYTRDGVVALGADHTILVDLGAAHGVEPGDFLTIYRYALPTSEARPVGGYWVNAPTPQDVEVPRTYLGEVGILAVGDRWAIGRVSDSYRLIKVGDEVELK